MPVIPQNLHDINAFGLVKVEFAERELKAAIVLSVRASGHAQLIGESTAVTEGGVLFTWVANVTNVRLVLITANYIVLTGNNIARARGVSGSCRTRGNRATNQPHDGWVGLNSSEFLP